MKRLIFGVGKLKPQQLFGRFERNLHKTIHEKILNQIQKTTEDENADGDRDGVKNEDKMKDQRDLSYLEALTTIKDDLQTVHNGREKDWSTQNVFSFS